MGIKVKVKQINLHKAEGVTKRAVAYSFEEANRILVEWANAPDVPTSGYDKTDFNVVFPVEDYGYKGTFDLKKMHSQCSNKPLLQNQMILVIKEAYSLLPVNEHPFPEHYKRERCKVTVGERQEALDYFENVDFEGANIGELEIINL